MPLSSVDLDVSRFVDFTPGLDYTQLDWKGILSDMADMIPEVLPEWTDYYPSDMGIVLLQLASGGLDIMTYRIDLAMNERFLTTCILRSSAIQLAKLIDYTPTPRTSSSVTLLITGISPAFIPKGSQFSTVGTSDTPIRVFETIEDAYVTVILPVAIVDAYQGETTEEVIGSSDSTAHQIFSLTVYPVAYDPGGVNSLELTVTEGGVPQIWTVVPSLLESGPSENHYEVDIDEKGQMSVIFGDNRNGKIPMSGTDNISAKYRVGGGEVGNVAADTITVIVSSIPGVVSVNNPGAATGGEDEESIESIKSNAPRSLRTVWKAVTAEDYKTLAEAYSGVAKAYAECDATGEDPYNVVNLYIAPEGGGNPSPSLKESLEEYFSEREMLCIVTEVQNPTYVDVDITLEVTALPNYLNSDVETRVTAAINTYFGFSNVDFGYSIYISDFLATLEALTGVDHSDLTLLHDTGDPPDLGNVIIEDTEIPQLGALNLTVTGGSS